MRKFEVTEKDLECSYHCPCEGERLVAVIKINYDLFTKCRSCNCVWKVTGSTLTNVLYPDEATGDKYTEEVKLVQSMVRGKKE